MRYAPYQQLDQWLDAIGAQLTLENNLRGLDRPQFAQRAAYYFDQYKPYPRLPRGQSCLGFRQ